MMTQYEYKVVPAPLRGEKARGAKTTPDRFALALTMLMNDLGQDNSRNFITCRGFPPQAQSSHQWADKPTTNPHHPSCCYPLITLLDWKTGLDLQQPTHAGHRQHEPFGGKTDRLI